MPKISEQAFTTSLKWVVVLLSIFALRTLCRVHKNEQGDRLGVNVAMMLKHYLARCKHAL